MEFDALIRKYDYDYDIKTDSSEFSKLKQTFDKLIDKRRNELPKLREEINYHVLRIILRIEIFVKNVLMILIMQLVYLKR